MKYVVVEQENLTKKAKPIFVCSNKQIANSICKKEGFQYMGYNIYYRNKDSYTRSIYKVSYKTIRRTEK